MDEIQAAIYAYFNNGEMPPKDKAWEPEPPKQWWSKPEDREKRKPIIEDSQKYLPTTNLDTEPPVL